MKKITVTLTDEAEKVFNEIMYSLPKEEDGTGMCTQSEAICYALQRMDHLEQQPELKICTGCGRLNNEPLGVNKKGEPYIACCFDNHYLPIKKYWQLSCYPQPISEERIKEMARNIAAKINAPGIWGDDYIAAVKGIKAALKELNKVPPGGYGDGTEIHPV